MFSLASSAELVCFGLRVAGLLMPCRQLSRKRVVLVRYRLRGVHVLLLCRHLVIIRCLILRYKRRPMASQLR